MIVLVDIGNSTVAFVSSEMGQLTLQKKLDTETFSTDPTSFFESHHEYWVSSVVPEIDVNIDHLKNVHLVKYQDLSMININVKNPNEVGMDRLLNAVGLIDHYNLPALIIDSGTAITGCLVTDNYTYQGGFIFPGMRISSKALNLYTSKIPYILTEPQDCVVGKSTKESVQLGLYRGYIHMINGFINQYRQAFPGLTVIGSGHGLDVLKSELDIDVYDEFLMFKGLLSASFR